METGRLKGKPGARCAQAQGLVRLGELTLENEEPVPHSQTYFSSSENAFAITLALKCGHLAGCVFCPQGCRLGGRAGGRPGVLRTRAGVCR